MERNDKMTGSDDSSSLTKKTETVQESIPKTRDRVTWGRQTEFILAALGYAVGLGNVWRFPYLCYTNGGGAYLIPYVLTAVFCGLPLYFLEIALGQYTKQGAIGAWAIAPVMQGVGCGSMMIAFYSVISYILVMTWSLFFLVHSFTTGALPWTTCGNTWNTNSCIPVLTGPNNETNSSFSLNVSSALSSVEEFWQNYVLQKSTGVEDIGTLSNWRLVLCFLAAWLIVYGCTFKGVRTSGKVVYFTATFPYVMLTVLFIRGITLEGAEQGVIYYLKPNMTKLAEPQVWIEAATQVFTSYGICYSTLIALGSFNRFSNDCYRQVIVLVTATSGTSLFAGFAIFSFLGHMATMHGKNMTDVVETGPGLAFLAYPTGVALLPLPHLWSVLFFGMLILVGIDSQFADVEGLTTAISDIWPGTILGKHHREKEVALICFVCMLIGLPLLTNGGIYIFQIYNYYGSSGICLLGLTFFESIGIGWVYGADKFYADVKRMIGRYPTIYFKYCYQYITPIISLAIFLFYCAKYSPLTLGGYEYPWWANGIGWLISLSSIMCVPIVFVVTIMQGTGSFQQRLQRGLKPRLGDHLQLDTASTEEAELKPIDS